MQELTTVSLQKIQSMIDDRLSLPNFLPTMRRKRRADLPIRMDGGGGSVGVGGGGGGGGSGKINLNWWVLGFIAILGWFMYNEYRQRNPKKDTVDEEEYDDDS